MLFRTKDYRTFWLEDENEKRIWDSVEGYRLFNGDIVRLELDRLILEKRTDKLRNIVGILQTSSKIRQGLDKRGHMIYIFRPLDGSLPEFIVASRLNNQLQNHWCVVDFLDWEPPSKRPRGSIVQDLGFVGDFSVEKAALYKHYRPTSIEHKTLRTLYETELVEIMELYASNNWKNGRVDLTNLDTYSIDPYGCKDIDDAFSLIGESELFIHIADVTPWIKPESVIDQLAHRHYSTLYGNEINFPMLPRELSEDICSLTLGKERAAITLHIRFTNNTIVEQTVIQSIIKNNNVLNYDNCDSISCKAKYFGQILSNQINCNEIETLMDSHKLIEIFMVYYNMYVASLPQCKLFRTQLSKTIDLPKELVFMNFESAIYSEINKGHYCLGIPNYTHATSPIRRYADIIVQRMIVLSLGLDVAIIKEMNQHQKLDKKFYRDLTFLSAIYEGDRMVEAIILDENYIYIHSWRQRVKYPNVLTPYSKIMLEFYVDPNPIQWKKKIVFSK
jgi:exoribonuclease R